MYTVPFTGVGGVALRLLTTRYLLGAGLAAVKAPLSDVVVTDENVKALAKAVGVVHGESVGGVKVNVSPDGGKTVLDNAQ
ncbi:MAG: hypothetical protein EOP51_25475, partial [Sphingobacteriales bacterium]